jgi:acetyl-CoA carboxylase biotin carboxyl carrier protein
VAQQKKPQPRDEQSSFLRFLRSTVVPLARAFAESPLAQLRMRTPEGSVVFAKPAPTQAQELVRDDGSEPLRAAPARTAPTARVYQGEAGRAYDTINAEVVGLFRDAAEPPSPGDRLEAGRVLGHIEALRLRNEVRCPVDCTLISQVVVDGQPVDFGEPLFVVDSGGAPLEQPAASEEPVVSAELAEPPRI